MLTTGMLVTSAAAAMPLAPLPEKPCTVSEPNPGSGLHYAGNSYYRYFRENYLSPTLPTDLGLASLGDRDWTIAIFGLTMFTEARQEADKSMAAAGAAILKRAGYDRPGFQIESIDHVAANDQFSAWLLACRGIKEDLRPPHPAAADEKSRKAAARKQLDKDAERLILYDPAAYAMAYAAANPQYRNFPDKLRTAVRLAQCMVGDAEAGSSANLAWVKEFGTLFVNPSKAESDTACVAHKTYLGTPGLAYCPGRKESADTHGWCGVPSAAAGPLCPSKPGSAQHYQLLNPHTEGPAGTMAALDGAIEKYVAACRASAGPPAALQGRLITAEPPPPSP